MTTRIRKAIIPAAGQGTRLLPATRVVPKELLPVAGKPLIQYAVEEAAASGIETVVVVLSKGKELILDHLLGPPGQDVACIERSGGVAELPALGISVEVRSVCQSSPRGLADAVRAARPLLAEESFAVILPDAVIDSAVPCVKQLMACHADRGGCVVATQLVDAEDIDRFGILLPAEEAASPIFPVVSLTERPARGTMPSSYGIFGRYILDSEIFDCIDAISPGRDAELQLTDALQLWARSHSLCACVFEGVHYDAGSKLGLIQANIGLGLRSGEFAVGLRAFLTRDLVSPGGSNQAPLASTCS